MRRICFGLPLSLFFLLNIVGVSFSAMTREQMIKAFDIIRNLCISKFSLSVDQLNELRSGNFANEEEDAKCYILCTAQMAGVLTSKKELHLEKFIKLIQTVYQTDNVEAAIAAAHACKDVQQSYDDPCDKAFFSAKCSAGEMGEVFMWP